MFSFLSDDDKKEGEDEKKKGGLFGISLPGMGSDDDEAENGEPKSPVFGMGLFSKLGDLTGVSKLASMIDSDEEKEAPAEGEAAGKGGGQH